MIISITASCKMNCPHCMSDCKPNGEHMSIQTFKDTIAFIKKNNIPMWMISGGEPCEHPDILTFIDILQDEWLKTNTRYPIVFITNGRELVRNKTIYDRMMELKKVCKHNLIIQVTDDPRFYQDKLTDKEKYWLKKLVTVIEPVPSNPKDNTKYLYPQGRAVVNFPDANWNTVGPKCINVRLMTFQGINTISGLITTLLNHNKTCAPIISPNGDIKPGESLVCPSIASIYDTESTIINNIKNCTCKDCEIAWDVLQKTNPTVYSFFV